MFEEVVSNIINHGYADDRDHHIEVCVAFPDESIVLRFDDDAAPYPLQHTTMIEPRPRSMNVSIGGRGLMLLRHAAERLQYERTPDHRNRLTVTVAARA